MKKRQRLAQLKWKILLVTTMSITVLWKCSPYIHPGPSGTVQLLNVKNLGTLNSAYLLGQASFSNDSVQSVQVSYDGGTLTSAVGTSSWKVAIPAGAQSWKDGSTHQVAVVISTSGHAMVTTSFQIKQGTNLDVDGDGYPDLVSGAALNGSSNQGGAYVFYGGPSGATIQPTSSGAYTCSGKVSPNYCTTLYNPDHTSNGLFGIAVALPGDLNGDSYADLIVTARNNGTSFQGIAYVFYGSSSGVASHPLGVSYTCSGNTSPNYCTTLYNPEHKALGYFGSAVAGIGDTNGDSYPDFVVGALSNGTIEQGEAHVFYGGANGIANHPNGTAYTCSGNTSPNYCTTLSNPDNTNGGDFGKSAAPAGDVNGDGYSDFVIGAEDNGSSGQGEVFVFYGGSGGITNHPDNVSYSCSGTATGCSTLYNPDHTNNGRFGGIMDTAGDVNGDGYGDILVAATQNGSSNQGEVFVFYGGSNGVTNHPLGVAYTCSGSVSPNYCTTLYNPDHKTNGRFGSALSSAGDVNGDGYVDVLVGASSNGTSGVGYIFYGSANGLTNHALGSAYACSGYTSPNYCTTLNNPEETTGGAFASRLGIPRDVNADGYSDLILGASSNGSSNQGGIHVFYGGPNGIANHPNGTGYTCSGNVSPNYCVSIYNPDDTGGDFGRAVAWATDNN